MQERLEDSWPPPYFKPRRREMKLDGFLSRFNRAQSSLFRSFGTKFRLIPGLGCCERTPAIERIRPDNLSEVQQTKSRGVVIHSILCLSSD